MILGQLARGVLPFAVFLTVIPGLLLLAEKPGTAAFVITAFTVIIGAAMLAITLVVLRFTRRTD